MQTFELFFPILWDMNVFLQPDNKFPDNCIFVRKTLLFLYLLGCFAAKA